MRTISEIEKEIISEVKFECINNFRNLVAELLEAENLLLETCEPPDHLKHHRYHFLECIERYDYRGYHGSKRPFVPIRWVRGLWTTYAGNTYNPHEAYKYMNYRYLGPAIYNNKPPLTDSDIIDEIRKQYPMSELSNSEIKECYPRYFKTIKNLFARFS